ncbi:hypothetical protein PMG71_18925 [Roseofilum sp. BLCC_M154]|uniref:HEAT repeat domain-containing protein n=1 Tax=Roseofilum acuticapitatum BLCC-M154 TaxID=3022444 RepID=A0ABT7AX73_9CYAN|nr:hypothetical protein [Roseofilum acuticapitatum]MDJ1171508.1 hypothetical protein [Roseofilum acuticapitatum BLCC-M154]
MDFSEIQPVSLNSHLGQPISINNAADLSLCFNSMANVGDRVEMFFSIAENDPKVAIRSFITVIRNSTSAPIRALAIQSLGKVAQPYKQLLASCESQESQDLLKLLCAEVQSRKNDLTTWAALEALKEIGFSPDNIQHPDGGNLSEPPRRIQNELLDRQVAQITKIKPANTRGQTTAEYERFLEFWAYGPISELFNENLRHFNYLNLVRDVLHLTQIRGVQLGLSANNQTVREESFTKIQEIFRGYSDSQDKKFRKALENTLKIRFLKEDKSQDADLGKLTRAILYNELTKTDYTNSDLQEMTVKEMEATAAFMQKQSCDISTIFSSAIEVLHNTELSMFLIKIQKSYLDRLKPCITMLGKRIELLRAEILRVYHNVNLLNEIFQDISRINFKELDDSRINTHSSTNRSLYDSVEYDELCFAQQSNTLYREQFLKIQHAGIPRSLTECRKLDIELDSVKRNLQSQICNCLDSQKKLIN